MKTALVLGGWKAGGGDWW